MIFKIDEFARLLRCDKSTLRRWEKKGKLETKRTIGNHRIYTIEQLIEILGEVEAMNRIKEEGLNK